MTAADDFDVAGTRNSCNCDPDHGIPSRTTWAVWVGAERNADGNPVSLDVRPTNAAHVAEDDAIWARAALSAALFGPTDDQRLLLAAVGSQDALEVARQHVHDGMSPADAIESARLVTGEGSA